MSSQTIMLKLSSNPRNVSLVETFVEKVAQRYKVSPDKYGDILISLTEAVNNAIIHGNQNDESKSVQIQCQKRMNAISFSVTDEGPGFDPHEIPDPTSPENLLKVGGRGVFLMRQLSDELFFSNNGTTVELLFRLR